MTSAQRAKLHRGPLAQWLALIAVGGGLVALAGLFGVHSCDPQPQATAAAPAAPVAPWPATPALNGKSTPFDGVILGGEAGEAFIGRRPRSTTGTNAMGVPFDLAQAGERCDQPGCFTAEIVSNPDGGPPRMVYGLTTLGAEPPKPKKKESP